MKIDKKALMEAGQEVVRVVFFASVSALIAWGLAKLGVADQTDTVVILGTLVLKGLDKYIHDAKFIKFNGLTDTKILKV